MSTDVAPRRRRRPTRHLQRNLVAYLALVVALALSPLPSWAAQKIGTKQLRKAAVTAAKIKNGAVGTRKLKDQAVTSAKLAPVAVGSEHIVEGAIGPEHLADGAVTADALAEEVRGFTIIRTYRKYVIPVAAGQVYKDRFYCPIGETAISGGGYIGLGEEQTPDNVGGRLVLSHPVGEEDSSFTPTGWFIGLENTTDEDRLGYTFVTCASR